MNSILSINNTKILLIAALFVVLAGILFYPVIRAKVIALISYKKRKLFKYDLSVQSLLNHPILTYLNLQQVGIQYLFFDTPAHTEAVKDMLVVLFTTYKKAIQDFVIQGSVLADKYAFKALVGNTILKMDKTCESEWLKLDIENKEDMIASFHQWQSDASGFLNRAIINVTQSDIYDNNMERIQEILSLLQTKFDMTIPDIDRSFGLPTSNKEVDISSLA